MNRTPPIAVTGGTGFVGQAVLERAADIPVKAITRREQLPRDNVEWISGDLGDEAALAALVEGSRALIHIAGLTNTPDLAAFHEANVAGTARVIDW